MPTATEVCQVKGLSLLVLKQFIPMAIVAAGDTHSTLACPACKRTYGTMPTFHTLNPQRCVIKCTCGKHHLGYKPFNGYQ